MFDFILTIHFEGFSIIIYRMTRIAITTPKIVKIHAPRPIVPPTNKGICFEEEYGIYSVIYI